MAMHPRTFVSCIVPEPASLSVGSALTGFAGQLVPGVVLHQLINIVSAQLPLQLLYLTHSLISFLCMYESLGQ